MCPEILVITGDFNFLLDDSTNSDANTFTEQLELLFYYDMSVCQLMY